MGFYGLCYFYATITVCNAIWGLITIPDIADNRNKSLVDVENSSDVKTPLRRERKQDWKFFSVQDREIVYCKNFSILQSVLSS